MLYQEQNQVPPEALNLKGLRKKFNLTQTQLGEVIHRSAATVCSYEKGDTPIPSKVLQALAEYFHVSMDAIAGRKAEGKSEPVFDITEREMKMLEGCRRRTKPVRDVIYRLATMPEDPGDEDYKK